MYRFTSLLFLILIVLAAPVAKLIQAYDAGSQIKAAMKGAADKRDKAAIDRAKHKAGVA